MNDARRARWSWRWPRTVRGALAHGALVQVPFAAVLCWAEWTGAALVEATGCLVLTALLVTGLVGAQGVLASFGAWQLGRRLVAWTAAAWAVWFATVPVLYAASRACFLSCAQRAQPLIDAITRFTSERGGPPERLDELVPVHLAAVPGTGMAAHPAFRFTRFGVADAPSPWELSVPCARFLQFDTFFYWPTQRYPASIYGGSVHRIGTWAYVSE